MSVWLALALTLIVVGGFAILRRLHLLGVAISFWLVFAAGIAVLATTEHAMTRAGTSGPITGAELWRILVFSPEILVFLFFMITDPKTVPEGPQNRRAFGAAIGLLAVLLIAPQTTEFATKVAVLAALALVCAARPLIALVLVRRPDAAGRGPHTASDPAPPGARPWARPRGHLGRGDGSRRSSPGPWPSRAWATPTCSPCRRATCPRSGSCRRTGSPPSWIDGAAPSRSCRRPSRGRASPPARSTRPR